MQIKVKLKSTIKEKLGKTVLLRTEVGECYWFLLCSLFI
jgi:hypothetical protein